MADNRTSKIAASHGESACHWSVFIVQNSPTDGTPVRFAHLAQTWGLFGSDTVRRAPDATWDPGSSEDPSGSVNPRVVSGVHAESLRAGDDGHHQGEKELITNKQDERGIVFQAAEQQVLEDGAGEASCPSSSQDSSGSSELVMHWGKVESMCSRRSDTGHDVQSLSSLACSR